jgi:hypothetical protein|tara:strand:+ start:611 stop:781 length:171 start_codon:yes stop_codon:yes gene_type:complete
MSISISESPANTVSVSVNGSTAVNFTKKSFSISATPSAAVSTVLTDKLIRSIQVVA